jgi:L-ribulose-5-phosphate 4-epimerase
MIDEGYIKFQAHWQETVPLEWSGLQALNLARQRMYDLGLIGAYENGIGYGNISSRYDADGRFVISGSATGNYATLGPEHYALVTQIDIPANELWCEGPIIASSESMSHAVIYQNCPEVNAVIHVHDLAMWHRLLHQVPTTAASATYGTPEMADSIVDLLHTTDLKQTGLFVMEGHREGVFAFGNTLDQVGNLLEKEKR